jgi:hypothetical protein
MSISPESHKAGIQKYGNVRDGTPQPEWNVSDNGKGLLSGTLKFFYDYNTGKSVSGGLNIPKRGDRHPYDERLVCSQVQTNYGTNDIAYCDAQYVGLLADPTEAEWELSCPTEEDPIQTHPDFLSIGEGKFNILKTPLVAGKLPAFDADQVMADPTKGGFQRFKDMKLTREKDLVGVTSFKVPRATMKVTYHTASQAYWFWSVQYLGYQIQRVPLAPQWTDVTALKRSWLLTSTSVTEYGASIYKVQTEYMLSGIGEDGSGKPWNKLIYKTFSPPI